MDETNSMSQKPENVPDRFGGPQGGKDQISLRPIYIRRP